MASMRDIKRRKGSIQSTQQITKAMKLVSTVKLQKAKRKAEESKPYFNAMYRTVCSILEHSGNIRHPYLNGAESGAAAKKAVIVITSNRGLAGGYNSGVTKLITQGAFSRDEIVAYTVGKKGRDALERGGWQIQWDASAVMEEPSYADALHISREVLEAYRKGEIGEIYLAYTVFRNTVTHIPCLRKLLPVDVNEMQQDSDEEDASGLLMNFEMEEAEALELLVPKYITGMIYSGLLEGAASENGARMQVMDSATGNAEEMIEELSLLYNRARQGSITQELTEIIAGASAID